MAGSIFELTNHEVFLLTARHAGRDSAMIATWIVPATLAPDAPRVLAALSLSNFTVELVSRSGRFALQMLARDQADLVPLFGLRSSRDLDKFSEVPVAARTPGGLPLIDGTCGFCECHVVQRVELGDRVAVIADIVGQQARSPGVEPLRARDLADALPAETVAELLRKRAADGIRDSTLIRRFAADEEPGR